MIASQAVISGAFSLTRQAVQLGYCPRFDIDHTSREEIGQIYIPAVNWVLMIACVGLVLGFRTSSNLAAAYGVAVTTTMVITTILLFVVVRESWGWSAHAAGCAHRAFPRRRPRLLRRQHRQDPARRLVPAGGRRGDLHDHDHLEAGRRRLTAALKRGELPIERFIGSITLHPQLRVPGTAVYLFPDPGITPPALLANLRHNEVLHETVVLVAVQTSSVPRVPQVRRSTVHDLGEGFVQVVLHFGFMDEPDIPKALANIVDPEFGFDPDESPFLSGGRPSSTVARAWVGPGRVSTH